MKRVVIIGAGIGGLSTALSLEQGAVLKGKELEIILLERKERIGGNIRSEKVDGFLIEGGPDCFLSEKPWAMELAKKLGLGDKACFRQTNLIRRHMYSQTVSSMSCPKG